MYLKSIELSGFKSFAKKSELHFTSSISAIVGPNGSGKSNVAEAFRFVLGEQSMKSMRGKRGEDLIWNGSPDVARSNRASVKVTFDNSTKFLSIDFPEVTIERVVHRDSQNEYFINGSPVRLKDVAELLAQAHVGSSGHHMISQGEADRVLNASPRERKAMIEDALGLKLYLYKKQESEKKLAATEENMREVESLRREIAPHIKFLKKQVEKAEKVAEMKETLRKLYQEYLHREELYLDRTKKALQERAAPLSDRQAKLEEELAAARRMLEASQGRDARSDKILDLQTKLKQVRADRDTMTLELGRVEGEISSLGRLIDKEKRKSEEGTKAMVYVRDVEMLAASIREKITGIMNSVDMKRIREGLVWIGDALQNFVSEKRESGNPELIAETEAEIAELRKASEDLHKKIHDIRNVEQGHGLEYELLKMEIEKEKDTSRDAEKDVFRIQADLNESAAALQAVRAEEERLGLIESDFRREREEGALLLGRIVLEYRNAPIVDQAGEAFSEDGIAAESRQLQDERRREIEKLKIRLEDAGAGGFDDILKEYQDVTERDQFLEKELSDLVKSAETLRGLIAELEVKVNDEFKNGVERINAQFGRYFSLMFGGGTAELRIIRERKRKRGDDGFDDDEAKPFSEDGRLISEDQELFKEEEGIDVEVNLPRKKIKALMMLSGGERALTSIALLFAISQVNPPPFIILDETDAALDEANSKKYGDMIENLSKHSQLIVITHNRETMSRAGILYGITMNRSGVSTLLSIKFEEAAAVAK